MLEETAQADGILSALTAKKPAAKKKKAKKAKKATAKKPAAKKAKKAAKKKPAAKKKAAKKPAKKKAAKKVAKKAAKKPAKKKAAKKTAKKAAKKPAKKKVAKKTAKKAVKKAAKKPAKRKASKAKKSVKKPKDGAAVNLKVFTTTASSKAGQSATTFKNGIQTLGSSLVSFAQDQLQESVLTAQQLMNCRSLEDVATVQTKFVKQSFDRLVKQANKMAQTTATFAKGAAEPLSDRMESLFNKYRAA